MLAGDAGTVLKRRFDNCVPPLREDCLAGDARQGMLAAEGLFAPGVGLLLTAGGESRSEELGD